MNSRNPANRYIYARPPRPTYLTQNGERVFRTVRDKLGDIIRVYRAGYVHRPGGGYDDRQERKAALREQLQADWLDAAQ